MARRERILTKRVTKAVIKERAQRQREAMRSSLDDEQAIRLSAATWAAFRAIADGQIGFEADEGHWGYLAQAANISMILCERGIGAEFLPDVIAAQEALAVCKARSDDKDGVFRFTGPEYQAVERMLEVHDAQLGVATGAEIMSAIDKIKQRLRQNQVIEVSR